MPTPRLIDPKVFDIRIQTLEHQIAQRETERADNRALLAAAGTQRQVNDLHDINAAINGEIAQLRGRFQEEIASRQEAEARYNAAGRAAFFDSVAAVL